MHFFLSIGIIPFVMAISSQKGESDKKMSYGNWIQHKNPVGFTVRHPAGWKVETSPNGFIQISNPEMRSFVIVLPFISQERQSARDSLDKLDKIFPTMFPKYHIEQFKQIREKPDEGSATFSYERKGEAGKANVLCSIADHSGMMYIIAAPKDRFAKEKPVLLGVLDSFSFTEPSQTMAGKKPDDPKIKYVRWSDPRENAFSLEVPEGWQVQGGLYRFASVDVRSCVALVSPDGQIRITGGDAEVPTFSIPFSPLFPEGSWYSPGYGVNMLVMHYLTGVEFAKEYVKKKAEGVYSDLTFTETKDRPDVAQTLNTLNTQSAVTGVSVQTSVGEVAFTCRSGQQKLCGYYFAGTTSVTYPTGLSSGGIWHVPNLHGYTAAEDQVQTAQLVLDHGIQSVQINPQWFAMQQGITANTSNIVSRTHQEISNVINESYWTRQASNDDRMRNWSNMMLGQTDVVDPESGEKFKAASGHNYYWRKAYTDAVIGTNTYDRPDIDFTPLQEW
ncbi:MAG: hypothetical protein C4527_09625 [Candidatus Omnitrophota bacterium]|jgi:hypothetical protein|nr:MAG: hypothetical protein C4527_09625 [Candidatus Omnitrophota bacterium]